MKLTVLVQTFNHAPFIATALESVAGQITSFDYEIVIADDCSEDETREIVLDFAARHPEQTRLILPESNLGHKGNAIFFRLLEAARGQYTALLDGDDYWTSSHKLQRQINFLDANPGCSTCFHDVNVVYEDGSAPSHGFHQDQPWGEQTAPRPRPVSGLADIVRGNFISTCSVVFRTPDRLPGWIHDLAFADWPLHVLNAERGGIAYIDEVMGVYRIHSGGVWSGVGSQYRRLEDVEAVVEIYDAINRHLRYAFDDQIRRDVAGLYERAAVGFARRGDHALAAASAWRSLRRLPPAVRTGRWSTMAMLAMASFRGLRRLRSPQQSL